MKFVIGKKSKRALAVIGAGIILTTFVVKEAFREDLKDFVDDLDNAAGVFAIRRDFNSTAFQLRVIEQKIDRIEQLTGSPTKDPFTLMAVEQQAMIVREWLDAAEITADNVSRLSERLSDDRKDFYTKSLEAVRNQIASARASFRVAGIAAASAASRVNADGTSIPDDRNAIANANTDLQNKTNAAVAGAEELTKAIREEADTLKAQKEHRFRTLTIASYICFGLGWLLALIGRLVGEDSISGIG